MGLLYEVYRWICCEEIVFGRASVRSSSCFITEVIWHTSVIFSQTQQYTVLTLGIGTIFIDQLPNFHVSKSAYFADIKIFNILPSNLRSLKNEQTQFKVALKRYLNTQSFYSVKEFLAFKKDLQYLHSLLLLC
jgi:hypothetical protein